MRLYIMICCWGILCFLLVFVPLTHFFPLIEGHCFYDPQGDPLPGLLTTLPMTLSSLSHLVHLDLSFNQLSSLPPCLLSIPVLSSLLLSYNRLSALPPDFGQLSSLTYLSLLGNKLFSLPPSMGQLKALQTLDVSHNLLQHLPDEIGSLGQLVKLELSHNRLKQLPDTLGKDVGVLMKSYYCSRLEFCHKGYIKKCVNLSALLFRLSPFAQGACHL